MWPERWLGAVPGVAVPAAGPESTSPQPHFIDLLLLAEELPQGCLECVAGFQVLVPCPLSLAGAGDVCLIAASLLSLISAKNLPLRGQLCVA